MLLAKCRPVRSEEGTVGDEQACGLALLWEQSLGSGREAYCACSGVPAKVQFC